MLVVREQNADPLQLTLWLLIGCAAVLGHVFPSLSEIQRRQRRRDQFGNCIGPVAVLHGLRDCGIWRLAGSCAFVALCFTGFDCGGSFVPSVFDHCDYFLRELGTVAIVAASVSGDTHVRTGGISSQG